MRRYARREACVMLVPGGNQRAFIDTFGARVLPQLQTCA
jgi:hypothetical protein